MWSERIIDTTCFCFRWWESSKNTTHTTPPPIWHGRLSFSKTLCDCFSIKICCMSVNISLPKWIIIHNDMNLYTLLINQCCRLNIIYLYVYSLDIASPRDITNVFMRTSNQNRNTYTLVKVVSKWKENSLVLFLWRNVLFSTWNPLLYGNFEHFRKVNPKRVVRNVSTIKSRWKVFTSSPVCFLCEFSKWSLLLQFPFLFIHYIYSCRYFKYRKFSTRIFSNKL